MSLSREIRRLENTWQRGDFPKHLEWIELIGLRGWSGQRVDFKFPIVAIVGENGVGKSTILQAGASIYKAPEGEKSYFASDFFPDTAWDQVSGVFIKASILEGQSSQTITVRKPTTRWRGNDKRRVRKTTFLDLRRTQPIYARPGYAKIAKRNVTENSAILFDQEQVKRFSTIVGKSYTHAKHSLTSADANRAIPVVSYSGVNYSGFHQGAGEATLADLISLNISSYSLVLIDEIETSLHPRAQRRLIRDLATIARSQKVQFIVTTHSPYILEELPVIARVHIFNNRDVKEVVHGVSPEFALSQMDEEVHPEIDIYVEDEQARLLLQEILAHLRLDLLPRVSIIPYGSASVGKALGTMTETDRFTRPTLIMLDADQDQAPGCLLLPGEDAPERQLFEDLQEIGYPDIAANISRSHSRLADEADRAMLDRDHHKWIQNVADRLIVGGNELWRAMSRAWVRKVMPPADANHIIEAIVEKLEDI